MNTLAIAVTLRPGTTPADSIFVYTSDGTVSPYLKNNKGYIELANDKVPVPIRFRLTQSGITIGGVAYKLGLPIDAFDVRDANGKWPANFSVPKLSGPPGGPNNIVEIIDQNDDKAEYKYAIKVDFTPAGNGPVVPVADDPKIRNGGETRSPPLSWTTAQWVLVAFLVLVGFLLGYWLRGL